MGAEIAVSTVELPPPTLRTRIRRLLFGSVEWSLDIDGKVIARGTTRTARGSVRAAARALSAHLALQGLDAD